MPVLDGVGLLRELRANPRTRVVPVVLVSARAGEEAVLEALGGGADDYLLKPFSPRELLARVETHVKLTQARREAEESRLKDAFLDLAAHELKTPLTALRLCIELLQRAPEGASPGMSELLTRAGRALGRMEGMVTDLLTVSAIKAGKLSLRVAPADLAAICRSVAAEQSEVYGRPVRLELPAEGLEATVDAARIGQALGHLLSNAFKFSMADRPVSVALRRDGSEASIAVSDEGPGIAPEVLPRVFERFACVPGVAVTAGSRIGLGIGLFSTKAIVEQHGGRVRAESALGRGSTFTLTVPLAASK